MREITIKLYKYDELSDKAKERARDWYREVSEYPWYSEAAESIKAFCDEFGVKVLDYEYGPYNRHNHIDTDATNANFRGFKFKNFDRESMPTGYCLDSTLRYAFADNFAEHGALNAFKMALEAAIRDIVSDVEYQYTDEAVEESIIANEYEFTEEGKQA